MGKALIGAGGFSREVKYHMNDPEMICFVDDQYYDGIDPFILPISTFDPERFEVLVAVGDPLDREKITKSLPTNTRYFTFVHPSAQILDSRVRIGEGSIICANTIITTDIKIGNHCHLNLASTIGHDCVIGDFFTTAPGAKVSGNCIIGDRVYMGTNASIKQKITICGDVTVGMNSCVVKNITEPGVYVGTPAKKIIK